MKREFIISAIKLIQDKNSKSVNVDELIAALSLFVGLTLIRKSSQENHSSRTYEVDNIDLALKFHCVDNLILQVSAYDKIKDGHRAEYAWISIM